MAKVGSAVVAIVVIALVVWTAVSIFDVEVPPEGDLPVNGVQADPPVPPAAADPAPEVEPANVPVEPAVPGEDEPVVVEESTEDDPGTALEPSGGQDPGSP